MISALRLEWLSVERGGRLLFRDLCARVAAGEALTITGPNGAGKTSLLRAVAGFIRPVAGEVIFDGIPDAAEARRSACHLIGHQDGFKGARSAREELEFQVRWTGASGRAAMAAAERLGIARQLDLEIRRLSAGQRRRLSIARLIAAKRPLWLLDEALAPLDAAGRDLAGDIMTEHLATGGLILAAAHDPLPIASRVLEFSA